MYKLVLMRHGESQWNLENRFTGWADVDLTYTGRKQAHKAGKFLKDYGYTFDLAYSSVLKRAVRTLWITLDAMDIMHTPIGLNWRLNEKHYGQLQGFDKSEIVSKFGENQVSLWRRSYTLAPKPVQLDDTRHPRFDSRYARLPSELLPATESLKDTVERIEVFWKEVIVPAVLAKRRVLIVAHGNSLRAFVKNLDKVSDEDIAKIDIPTAQPLVYELDKDLQPLQRYYPVDRA